MASETSMPLSLLIARLPASRMHGDRELLVSGITHDSRSVRPGDIFVCLKGAAHDGHAFVPEVLAKGAAAVVANEGGLERAGVSLPSNASVITVADTRSALPLLACAFYQDPSHSLTMVGVTGTNGKTTTTRMVAAILRAAGQSVATIGTLGAEIDGKPLPSEHTTPESDQLQALLAKIRDARAQAVVMEVSSHALSQHRTDGIAFNAGIFTNLTQDHLDYHKTMEAYLEAKALLFIEYPMSYPRPHGAPFVAVINTSAPEGRKLAEVARGEVVTFAAGDQPAMLRAEHVELNPSSARFDAVCHAGADKFRLPIVLPIGGAFQVGNALGAIAAAWKLGVSLDTIASGLAKLPPVPGRFEAVSANGRGYSVIVDYAHSPDGLENLIRSAKDLKPERILLVFGCGGNRDRAKRPIMGRLAATLTDVAIVTSDNPRHEEPGEIIQEILTGMQPDGETSAEIHVEPDRRKAIHLALGKAKAGDMVLIAGKGHEDYQIVGDQVLPFDDRLVAREWLASETR